MRRIESFCFALVFCCALPGTAGEDARRGRVLAALEKTLSIHVQQPELPKRFSALLKTRREALLRTASDAAFASGVNAMLDELHTSHLTLLPPPGAAERTLEKRRAQMAGSGEAAASDAGIFPTDTGEAVFVAALRKNSSAERAGVRVGDKILSIDGMVLNSKTPPRIGRGLAAAGLLSDSREGASRRVRFCAPNGAEREVVLELSASGGPLFSLGLLGPLPVQYASELRPDGVLTVRFNFFLPETLKRFRADVRKWGGNARALVMDLRCNGGGLLDYASWFGAWSFPGEVNFGALSTGGAELKLVSMPQKKAFRGPVAVLTDAGTASTAEIFAAGVQESGLGRVFGGRTAGKCLPSVVVELPEGFVLQTAHGDFHTGKGARLERKGLTPQEPVKFSVLPSGRDAVLEKACAWALGEGKK